MKAQLRSLPSVDALLSDPRLAPGNAGLSRDALTGLTRQALSELRQGISSGGNCPPFDEIVFRLVRRARALGGGPRHVINATGVVLHTNLGRAPMSDSTIEAMSRCSRGFVDLELDLESGKRGSRQDRVEPVLCLLSGAEAGMVVNNNASAMLLGLTALAKGKEVVVSRGQAVQIGGGVRIPDILRQGGAKLVEVGTTNVTEIADYDSAITPRTAALLRVHSSNFKIIGFTGSASLSE
ncbi:MAG: L-seryl-tRNA(Sec) selenium transferase, partial [Chloroflexi bacterium]|nr:L-seryl-tRNA(Sec) selenium transferase [Chloroflexota bacterium]